MQQVHQQVPPSYTGSFRPDGGPAPAPPHAKTHSPWAGVVPPPASRKGQTRHDPHGRRRVPPTPLSSSRRRAAVTGGGSASLSKASPWLRVAACVARSATDSSPQDHPQIHTSPPRHCFQERGSAPAAAAASPTAGARGRTGKQRHHTKGPRRQPPPQLACSASRSVSTTDAADVTTAASAAALAVPHDPQPAYSRTHGHHRRRQDAAWALGLLVTMRRGSCEVSDRP